MALKILIVEDDPPTLELMDEVLTSLKAEVRALSDSEQASALVNQERFDGIFDVLTERDAEKMRFAAEWAHAQGKEISRELAEQLKEEEVTDSEIETLIAERNEAKKNRDFKRADAIRQQLADKGIILEDTKDGVRWKRK